MKYQHGNRRKTIEYEKALIDYWKKHNTFQKSIDQNHQDKSYVFYDGPPFITGNPHHGTLLSSVVKDAVPRFWTMNGFRVERRWGWDCHGLPAENFTEKHLGGTVARTEDPKTLELKIGEETSKISLEKYIETARDLMVANSATWESTIDRIGRWVDFKGAYKTMDKDFMESVWWAFKELYEKGKIYEGEKVLMYDTTFATPVSKNEVTMDNDAYQTVTDPSVFVKFQIKNKELTGDTIGNRDFSINDGGYIGFDISNYINEFSFPEKVGDLVLKNNEFHASMAKFPENLSNELREQVNKVSQELSKELLKNPPKLNWEFRRVIDKERDRETIIALLDFDFYKWQKAISEIAPGTQFTIPHTTLYIKNGPIGVNSKKQFDDMTSKLDDEIVQVLKNAKYKKYLLAWTTTPWTLPANTAVAVNAKLTYIELRIENDIYILAKTLADKILIDDKKQPLNYEILQEFTGDKLIGKKYHPIFADHGKNAHQVYAADYVDDSDGTGIVHLAPIYGEVDFDLAEKEGVPKVHAIDDHGYYYPEIAEQLHKLGVRDTDEKGIEVWAANKFIAKCLEEQGTVWKIDYIRHEYPFNTRSKQRIMYRAIPSWFLSIDKPLMLEQNQNINWFPGYLKNGRFAKNIEQAPDWNLSRDRFWATPMPVWKGDQGTIKVIGSYQELEQLSGKKLQDYHRPWIDDIEFDLTLDGKPVRSDDIMLPEASGEAAIRKGEPITKRPCVDAIIVNQKGEYLLLDEPNRGIHFVGGGVDPEDANNESAILREIAEETGYTDIETVRPFGPLIHHKAFNINHGKNYDNTTQLFEVVLKSDKRQKSEVEDGKHSLRWVKKPEVEKLLDWEIHKVAFKQYDLFLKNSESTENTGIKAVIFDCFKVLVEGGTLAVLRQFDPDKKHEKEFKKLIEQHDLGKSIGWLCDEMSKINGVPASEMMEAVKKQIKIKKNTKLLNYIQKNLAGKYKIGLLSNVGPRQLIDNLVELDWGINFDDKVLSYEVGMTKPDKRIFELAAERLGVKPSECIFVDDKDNNIAVAEKVGMKGVLFNDTTNGIAEIKKLLAAQKPAETEHFTRIEKETTYILCGGRDRKYDNFGKNLAKEITKVVQNPKILDVFFMRPEQDWLDNFQEWTKFYDKYFDEYSHKLATLDNFYEQAKNADVVFFHGGQTSLLLKNLPDFKKVKEAVRGKIYIGSSAGAEYISEHFPPEDGVETGSSILPINVVTHYESDWEEYNKQDTDAKKLEKDFPQKTLRIHEGEFEVIKVPETEHFTRIEKVLDCWFESGSMPFAQLHYPFENKEKFEKNYPADFIVEYIGQVRAWFYYVHAVNTALFGTEAYKNVITTGTLAGNDGRKMSKSLGNYTDPNELMDKYSADALRFLMLSSPVLSGEDFALLDKDVSDISRKLAMIWNMYDFFTMYAEVDGWDSAAVSNFDPAKLTNPLDIWVTSRAAELRDQITKYMNDYNLPDALSPVLPFIDDASNWYVRRSRRRFWKSEDDADKNDAYATLFTVLKQLSRLLAPFTPFLAEELYQKMTGEESVHLLSWPTNTTVDQKVLDDMSRTRQIIEKGLALRMDRSDEYGQIKVRQPLRELKYGGEQLSNFYEQIIAEEVNVKKVTHHTGELALDKKLDTELREEGFARELIRFIQSARKKAGLQVDDRINLSIIGLPADFSKNFLDLIKGETLAVSFSTDTNYSYDEIVKVDGKDFTISLQKA